MVDESGPGSSNGAQPSREQGEFHDRLTRFFSEAMSEEELRAFNAELETSTWKQEAFVRSCIVQSALTEELSTQYHVFREALVARQAQIAERKEPSRLPETPASAPPFRKRRWMVAAGVGIAVMLASILLPPVFRKPPHMEPFARVTDSYHAQWENGPEPGGLLQAQTLLTLNSGWAEITYDTGTRVTIIGPSSFTAESPYLLDLKKGRLSATVSGNNFAVLTPEARITDLGTEFGVSMLGSTEFAVFSGKIAASTRRDQEGKDRKVFEKGAAAGFSSGKIVDATEIAWPQLYPRRLPPGVGSLSVADLLSGGDGTMARRSASLSIPSGEWVYGRGEVVPASARGDHSYHTVPQVRVISGCFVPDGKTRIDSAGHEFDFSATQNLSYNQLWVGGPIPWVREDPHRMSTVLGGIDYSQSPHAQIEMHSNKGVTLDLEELRAIHPGVVFGEFHAIVGNTSPLLMGGERFTPRADVYILVDGEMRLEKRQISNQDNPMQVRIPIDPNDRFLTLAVTDGGDGLEGDWILLGDPEITVTSTGAGP